MPGAKTDSWLGSVRDRVRCRKEQIGWKMRGRPSPPPHCVKQLAVRRYGKSFSIDTLVESGTYLGEMVEAQRSRFHKIISIELSPELFEKAKTRFHRHDHVELLCGDSGELLKTVVPALDKPAIFWLDAHYSGGNTARGKEDTPILKELRTIYQSKLPHVILIDDARLFDGTGGYPTIAHLEEFSGERGYVLTFKDDIVRLTPGKDRSRSTRQ